MNKCTRPIAGFSLPADLLDQIDRMAEAEMISRSAWLRRAAIQALREAKKAFRAGVAIPTSPSRSASTLTASPSRSQVAIPARTFVPWHATTE
jgi:hypothetical protein